VNRLERQLDRTLKDLDLEYYPTGGKQVSLQDLANGAPSGDHLEIDGIIRSGTTCVLVEITAQAKKNSDKIKRFIRHADIFRNSNLNVRDRFRLLGIPSKHLRRFNEIDDWRYLYIGTGPELRERNIRANRFPEAAPRLTVFSDEDWAYLRLLQRNVGWIARNELFATLGLKPGHESGAPETEIKCDCVQLPGRQLGRRMPKADLFVTSVSAADLLEVCRVLRYQRLPMAVGTGSSPEEEAEAGYQRILSAEKLASLDEYIRKDPSVAFPSPIVVVARRCEVLQEGEKKKIRFPKEYSSIDVIDGQHRLFAYARVPPRVRNKALLLVTVVHFTGASATLTNRYAATTFITINKNQAKVKRELIILTSFDALGHDTGEAIAGKVLIKLNEKSGCPLAGRLRIRPLARTSTTVRALPIVTIALEIAPLVDEDSVKSLTAAQRNHFLQLAGTSEKKFARKEERVRVGVALVDRFMRMLAQSFHDDFGSEKDSYLMSPIYIAALLRRLNAMATTERRSWGGIERRLRRIAKGAKNVSGNKLAFPREGTPAVPELRAGLKKILDYIIHCETQGAP
jgi:DGQHR domain-containing protein